MKPGADYSSSKCPPIEVMAAFSIGRLPDDQIEQVGSHVDICPPCADLLDSVQNESDTVISAIGKAGLDDGNTELKYLDEPQRHRLNTRAKAIFDKDEVSTTWLNEDQQPVRNESPHLPITIGRYEIKRHLGRGGFADVYLAEDPELGREVAIKVPRKDRLLSAEELRRFEEEANTAANLKHKSIVEVYEVGRQDAGVYFAMEYMAGGSIADLLMTDAPLSPNRAARLLVPIAEALHYIHQRKDGREKELVHRDVKPANILLDANGRPHLADFGLALAEEDRWLHREEHAGTLPYMSPEQVRGEAQHLDGRTDIWSLGAILYEMLTGRRPFSSEDKLRLIEEIRHIDPKPPTQIDDAISTRLEQVCLRCLEKNVSNRYSTAAEFANELRSTRTRRYWIAAAAAACVAVPAAMALPNIFSNNGSPTLGNRGGDAFPDPIPKPGPNHSWLPVDIDLSRATIIGQANASDKSYCEYDRKTQTLNLSCRSLIHTSANFQNSARRHQIFASIKYEGIIDATRSFSFGLYFGRHVTASDEKVDSIRLQTVTVTRIHRRNIYYLSRRLWEGKTSSNGQLVLFPASDNSFQTSPEGTVEGLHLFDLLIGRKGLEKVQFDGDDKSSLVVFEANRETREEDYRGSFGFVVDNCAVAVHSMTYTHLSEE